MQSKNNIVSIAIMIRTTISVTLFSIGGQIKIKIKINCVDPRLGPSIPNFAIPTLITISVTLSGIGGQIKEDWKEGDGTTSAVTIRIADFINKVVATRR